MADNKNQHFVPKAHLKPFSVNGEGKAIHLFNLDRMQAFFDAPVKNRERPASALLLEAQVFS
ncbi:DUF4238 domain-containing protein [Sinorhizobium meliloti]|uniref:DUF4238 domain-containing protein n=1 Tax=Rhizobium meliloti TaxID=382 RepID=UPI003D65872A